MHAADGAGDYIQDNQNKLSRWSDKFKDFWKKKYFLKNPPQSRLVI